jgi:hypothetical protein
VPASPSGRVQCTILVLLPRARLSRACCSFVRARASCGGSFSRLPPGPSVFARYHTNCPAECAIEAGVRRELGAEGNIAHLTMIFTELIDALAHRVREWSLSGCLICERLGPAKQPVTIGQSSGDQTTTKVLPEMALN